MAKNEKSWDYDRPFQRINSPTYDENRKRADGRGFRCGCRNFEDAPRDSLYGWLIRNLMRAIPGWVAVDGEAEHEVQGLLRRSYQTWTDVPLIQWHQWYDWNYHIEPDLGYRYLRGEGNDTHGNPNHPIGQRPVVPGKTIECEWDCGAFGARPGAMFSEDWAWPLTGQHAWLVGRWIYDCGHATSDAKRDTIHFRNGATVQGQIENEQGGTVTIELQNGQRKTWNRSDISRIQHQGLMRAELHPCKAMATARWEAVKFKENNDLYVPGIQFSFFASRKGGYHTFPTIADKDYEFIIDLPKVREPEEATLSIGRTPEFLKNTGVLRGPQLLKKADFTPFKSATGISATVDPIVELVDPLDPNAPQAKIRIPMTSLPSHTDAYGVILSLGWYDPDKVQARSVSKCCVTIDNIRTDKFDYDVTPEEWLVKVGVNGRWLNRMYEGVGNEETLTINQTWTFWLSEDDRISISAHGAEIDLVGDIFERTDWNRTLRLNGVVLDWNRDIVHSGLARGRQVCYAAANMMASSFSDQNDPLGLIDPGMGSEKYNPLVIKGLQGKKPYRLRANFVSEVGESAELAENQNVLSYTLNYTVDVQPQKVS